MYAAKVLNRKAHQRKSEVVEREIDILRQLSNPNIVGFFGVETEVPIFIFLYTWIKWIFLTTYKYTT